MVFKVKVKQINSEEKAFSIAVNTAQENDLASLEAIEIIRAEYDRDNYSMESFAKFPCSNIDVRSAGNIYKLSYAIEDDNGKNKSITELIQTNEKEEDIIKLIPPTGEFMELKKTDFLEILQ